MLSEALWPGAKVSCHHSAPQAEWDKIGASPPVGIYRIVIKKTGNVIVYLPDHSQDFVTTMKTAGSRVTLGYVPRCSSKALYRWRVSGRTLTLAPLADKACQIRETFFGGRWKR